MSLLCDAAREGSISKCKQLLAAGSDVEERSKTGGTPLLIAAQKGHTEVCELLLDQGKANIEETTPKGLTALNLAAGKGHAGTFAFLLSKGAMVDTKTKEGCTSLMFAADGGHIEVCKLLLNEGKANVKDSSLLAAAPFGHTAAGLAAAGFAAACLVADGYTAACLAAAGLAIAGLGSAGKANPKDLSLIIAAQHGYTDVCELLLANGSDLEAKNLINQATALHEAATLNHESLLHLLLSHKADVNSRNLFRSTPLHSASQNGHLAAVVTLLQAGADPLLPTTAGVLPIHTAANYNHTEIVKILIEKGGCSVDQVRHTTLHSSIIWDLLLAPPGDLYVGYNRQEPL